MEISLFASVFLGIMRPETPRMRAPPAPHGPGGAPAPRAVAQWALAPAPHAPFWALLKRPQKLILRQITEISCLFFAIPPAIHSNLDQRPAGP